MCHRLCIGSRDCTQQAINLLCLFPITLHAAVYYLADSKSKKALGEWFRGIALQFACHDFTPLLLKQESSNCNHIWVFSCETKVCSLIKVLKCWYCANILTGLWSVQITNHKVQAALPKEMNFKEPFPFLNRGQASVHVYLTLATATSWVTGVLQELLHIWLARLTQHKRSLCKAVVREQPISAIVPHLTHTHMKSFQCCGFWGLPPHEEAAPYTEALLNGGRLDRILQLLYVC